MTSKNVQLLYIKDPNLSNTYNKFNNSHILKLT